MSVASRLRLYVRTVAALRAVQWMYLPWRRLQPHLPARVPAPRVVSRANQLRPVADRIQCKALHCTIERANAIVHGSFSFLNRIEQLDVPDWNRRYGNHLWNYNLHYFDYARDLARAAVDTADPRYVHRFLELAQSWTRETVPGHGDGWEPYPLSVRVVNWCYALALLGDKVSEDSRNELTANLARQVGWLERRLEKHIQGNHLQKNYFALAVAGLFFEGEAADRWRRIGLAGSWKAVMEQVLPDGGHYERSPMYHAIALQDFLELLALCQAAHKPVPEQVRSRVRSMVNAFGILSRHDGQIHLFNDAAHGIAPSREHLDRLACDVLGGSVPPPMGLLTLPESGYFGFTTSEGDRLLIDCGVPGPRHQPSHAHCDVLSFELDVRQRPVVVDSGVHGYVGDPFRGYVRSTRAHNTVMVGEREQTELWGTFRAARMARVSRAKHGMVGSEYRFEGAYAPFYDRGMRHVRQIVLCGPRVTITDRISGARGAPIRSFVHIHPRFEVDVVDASTVILSDADGETIRIEWRCVDRIQVGRGAGYPEGWYFPEFGLSEAAPVIAGERAASDDDDSFGYEIRWG